MDPMLTQIIITGLAGAVATLAGVIFRMQNQTITELKETIAKQNDRDQKRLETQEATTKTLQAVVDVGMERLRSQGQEPAP